MEQQSLYFRTDSLGKLNESQSLSEKLDYVHQTISRHYPFIERVAVAIYDPKTDLLKTFIHSSSGAVPLTHYQARLSEAASLRDIVQLGQPRVVNDLSIFSSSRQPHSKRLLSEGYAASYTLPMYHNSELYGFIFFNASQKGVFKEEVLHQLDLFGRLLALSVIQEISHFRTLQAAVQTARDITHHRDNETGSHLDRMSRYARLIAEQLATKYGFSDEYLEQIFLFSPLHDVGKIAIPDEILLKPGRLTEEEFAVMREHTTKGREIIDGMLEHFGVANLDHSNVLRNIAQYHHETLDGMGYPEGLRGEEIPIEARIIAVADIFDALTSERPYKEAWPNERAFALLQEMSGLSLDPDCVAALLDNIKEVERIQKRFAENPYA